MAVINLKDRKIGRQGLRGMGLRLPQSWLEFNGVKPGDVVGVAYSKADPSLLMIYLKKKPISTNVIVEEGVIG